MIILLVVISSETETKKEKNTKIQIDNVVFSHWLII